jgi:two-component system, NtrC family, response regulator HydG
LTRSRRTTQSAAKGDSDSRPISVAEYPSVQDLAANLRFDPAGGRVWLYDQPVLLNFASGFNEQRREIIDSVGMDRAREIYTRLGYREGLSYLDVARHIRSPEHLAEYFAIGPQLRAMQGFARIDPVKIEFDVSIGSFYSEVIWHETLESQAHLATYGVGTQQSCWMEVGAACGFCTAFMGRPILHREVECRALGHDRCRAIGKPLAEWGDEVAEDVRFLQFTPFINKLRPRRARKSRSGMVPSAGLKSEAASIGDREIVGVSGGFNAAVQLIKKVAPTDVSVLFVGESGVGKEIGARTLHALSNRSDKPFVAVNCAAIPETLIESELFGVQKGAYTGATHERVGRIERANTGTLFLDEIGTLSLPAQAKLLRVIQEREIERVGDTRVRPVDVRFVAATNLDLRSAIATGHFRMDLFYRLNVFPIRLAPLRERRADIPLLMDSFLKRGAVRHGKRVTGFTSHAVDSLLRYRWPGNVRELENMIERAIILCPESGPIDAHHLFTGGEQLDAPLYVPGHTGSLVPVAELHPPQGKSAAPFDWSTFARDSLRSTNLRDLMQEMQRAFVNAALEDAHGNVSEAARNLGLSYGQVSYCLRRQAADNDNQKVSAAADA